MGDAEKALRGQIESASGRQIALVSFRKTDGQQFELAGVKGYKLDFEGEIKFLTDGTWLSGGLGMPTSYEFKPGKTSGDVFQNLRDNIQGGQSVSSGSSVKISGSLTAEKTENGWKFHPAEGHAVSKPTSGPSVRTGPVSKKESIACVNNLKQIGLALREWGMDHDGDYPFNAATSRGGTKEICSPGSDGFDRNAFVHFMVMSNKLATPKILVCPADSSKHPASTWNKGLQADNVSYQMRSGADINETHPEEVVVRCPIHGHVVECDGSVQSPKQEH